MTIGRVALGFVKGIGLALVFVVALVSGVLLHLDTTAGRRAAASITNGVLGGLFKGKIVVDRVGKIGPGGLEGVDGRLVAETGEEIAELHGVRVRANVPSLVGGILRWVVTGKEPLTIRIDAIEIDHARLLLDRTRDEKKDLLVARAFESATPPEPPSPGPGPTVSIARIALTHAWLHGAPADGLAVDADVEPLTAEFHMEDGRIELGVSELRVGAREVLPGKAASLAIVAGLVLPKDAAGPIAHALVGGEVAHVPLVAEARYAPDRILATAGIPTVPAKVVSSFVPGFAPKGDLSARVEAAGSLQKLLATVHVGLGPGNLDAHARAILVGTTYVELGARARDFEIATFVEGGPPSRLGADVVGKLSIPEGGKMRADAKVVVTPTSVVAGQGIPETVLVADMKESGAIVADLVAREPGVPTVVHAELPAPKDEKGTRAPLAFTTRTALDLAAFTRFGRLGTGTGALTTKGTVDVSTLAIDAAADLAIGGVAAQGAKLARAEGHVDARGVASDLAVHGRVEGHGLRYDKYGVGHFAVSAGARIADTIVVRDAHVTARSKGETLDVAADEVVLAGGVDARGIRIAGLGEPLSAEVSQHGQRTKIKARSDGLDLAKLAEIVQIADLAGKLTVDTDLVIDGKEVEGTAGVALVDGKLPGVAEAHVVVDAKIHRRVAEVAIDGALGDALEIRASAKDVKLAGPALGADAWAHAEGRGWLDATGDFERLPEIVDLSSSPVTPLHGKARVQLGFTSAESGHVPSIDLAASTSGLVVVVAGSTPDAKPSEYRGIDVAAEARVDGSTGFSAVSARIRDKKGFLAMVDGKVHVPLEAVLHDPSHAAERLYDEPLGLSVRVPERKLVDLPPELGPIVAELRGRASVDVTLDGTVRKPRLVADVKGKNVKLASARTGNDVDVHVSYDGKHAALEATIGQDDKGKARIVGSLDAEGAKLLDGTRAEDLPWKAGVDVTFDRFSLAALPTSSDGRIKGRVDGHVKLKDFHENAEIDVALAIAGAGVGTAEIPRGTVEAMVKDGAAKAKVRLDQVGGKLELDAGLALAWGKRIVPEIDKSKALEARLYAKDLRAAIFAPFTGGAITDLDGRIDADARVSADVTGKNVKTDGYVTVRGATLVVASLGQEYRDINAKVKLSPGGVIDVDGITLSDGAGRLTGKATARFSDLDFVGANAGITIEKGEPLDVVIGGQVLGDAYGRVDVAVRNGARGMNVGVAIPSLHVRLSESAGKAVQELEPRDDVRVGVIQGRKLVLVPLSKSKDEPEPPADGEKPLPIDIDVKLGDDVEVKRGAMVAAKLTGQPHVRLADGKTVVSGQIQIPSGTLDLQGKKFTIEKGTVTFEGDDPSNPVVVATASWQAKDRTRVYADFIGPVKTGKVTLRAEPARTQSEILQLVVFGTADGFNAPPQAGKKPGAGTQAATTVAGSAFTQGLDSALDGLTGIETQTRIDTTSSNNPRPEIEVVVSRDVSLRFAYVLGTPPISEPDRSLGTVIYRFAPNWSISTTVGDRGKTTLDTIWQYRY